MKLWNPATSGHLHDITSTPWPSRTASNFRNTTTIAHNSPQNSSANSPEDELNQLHNDLIDLLAGLSVCTDTEFAARYHQLVDKIELAFRNEEDWMECVGYADISVHCEEHSRVLCALHKVHSQVMIGKLDQARQVAEELLPQWFSFHFETLDADLAKALRRGNA